jgi:hypothetical protein
MITCKGCLKANRKARRKFLLEQKKKGRTQRIAEREVAMAVMKSHLNAVMNQFIGRVQELAPSQGPLVFIPHFKGEDEIN